MNKELCVFIEINGVQTQVGTICGSTAADACFSYDKKYIEGQHPAISISLPLTDGKFSSERTKNFFEGLLPEGFARKSVAEWIHATEDDYLTILQALGSECLGAIRISSDAAEQSGYRELSMDEVRALAREGVTKSTELVTAAHLSLTGASGKVGLYYDEQNGVWYQPIGKAASTHIVKQSHIRHHGIVTNEQLALQTAAALGIEIPESFVLNTGNAQDDEVLFATKRYDRQIGDESLFVNGLPSPFRLHQEDFAQALGIASSDKYERDNERYLPKMFNILRNYSIDPITDQLKLWDIHQKGSGVNVLEWASGDRVRTRELIQFISALFYIAAQPRLDAGQVLPNWQ